MVDDNNLAAPDRRKAFRRQYSMSSSNQGLAAFGIAPAGGDRYLYDSVLRRIIGEGSSQAVRAKVAEWEPISPGRYRACTADQLDAGVLLDWQHYKNCNRQYWVIA